MGKRFSETISDDILEEALSLSFEKGILFVSTKEIASRLHISEPAIFSRFPSKKQLLQATYLRAWKKFSTFLKPPLLNGKGIRCFNESCSAYAYCKEDIAFLLTLKKEICFLKQFYSTPRYYDELLVQQAQRPFVESVKEACFPEKNEETAIDNMISFLLETTIASYFQLIRLPFLDNPRSREFLSNAAIYGPVTAIDIDYEEKRDE
jgi:AcrR family transcriptional regulator